MSCQFCDIANSPEHASLPPIDKSDPFASLTSATPDALPPAYMVLDTPLCVAFLDIFPLSRCHVLVCPRRHVPKLSLLSIHESSVLGAWLPIISRAALKVSGYEEFNIVQNNGLNNAHQTVPHVHFHCIPRPSQVEIRKLKEEIPKEERYTLDKHGNGWRIILGDDEAKEMTEKLRAEIQRILEEIEDGEDGKATIALLMATTGSQPSASSSDRPEDLQGASRERR